MPGNRARPLRRGVGISTAACGDAGGADPLSAFPKRLLVWFSVYYFSLMYTNVTKQKQIHSLGGNSWPCKEVGYGSALEPCMSCHACGYPAPTKRVVCKGAMV